MDLSVSYQYNKYDIINFVLDSFSFEKVRCTLILIMNVSLFVVGLCSMVFVKNIAMGVLLILFSIIVFPILLYMTYVTAYNSLKNITNVVCTIKDNGIDFMTNMGEHLIPYNEIMDVKVTEELIFVYFSKTSVFVIPKRAFVSVERAIDFSATLLERSNRAKSSN